MSSFIVLNDVDSKKEDQPVIINLVNIGIVYTDGGKTCVEMNYPRGSDRYPKTIHVKESFDEVQLLLRLSQ